CPEARREAEGHDRVTAPVRRPAARAGGNGRYAGFRCAGGKNEREQQNGSYVHSHTPVRNTEDRITLELTGGCSNSAAAQPPLPVQPAGAAPRYADSASVAATRLSRARTYEACAVI